MPQQNNCVQVTDAEGHNDLPPTIYDTDLATQLTYNIDFNFLAEADVVVYREQPAGTFTLLTNSATTGATPPNYTINQGVSPAQVTFAAGEAPGGVSLVIGRRTNICNMLAVYQVGAAIRAGDLNLDNTQLLNLIQELRSTIGQMINGNTTDPIIPGQGMDLGDLDDVTLADPIPNPSVIRWNGTEWVNNNVIETTDAWVANNASFATTAAGDARWLQTDGGNFIGGAGINIDTSVAGQATVEIDLDTPSGLETDPAGNTGELRINVNSGCEIVAAGLNAETTDASIVQTGNPADNDDPAIRIATTLGDTTTNNDLQIVGGTNITVTRDDDNQLTITATGGTGSGVDVQDDGTEIESGATTLNFTGDGVTVTDGGDNQANIAIAGGGSDLTIQNAGTALTTAATTLNFTGDGVTASGNTATKTINIPGGSGITIENAGTALATAATTLDFTGAGVTASGTGAEKTINIPGGGASVSIGTNPPEAAAAGNAGDLWFNDNTGRLFISYTDATPDSQWIDAAPAAQAETPTLQQVCDEGQTTNTGMSIGTDGSGNLIVGSAPTTGDADDAGYEFRPNGRGLARAVGENGGTIGINNGNVPFWVGPGDNITQANGSNFVVHAGNTGRTVELCAGETASTVSSGDRIGTIRWSAQNGTGLGGQIRVEANQDWTNSVFGSNMIFDVTPNGGGTTEQVLTLRNNGTVRQQGSSSGDQDQFTCGLQDDSNLNQGGNGVALFVSGANSGGTRLGIRRGTGTSGAASYLAMRRLNNNTSFFWTDESGDFRVGDIGQVGSTNGTVVGTQTSDRRVKQDITSYVGGLDLIEQLNPVNFKYTQDSDRVRVGFIAQDVQSVIPEAVYDTGERIAIYKTNPVPMADLGNKPDPQPKLIGYLPEDEPTKLAMDYVEIIPALVNAVKELSAEVKALKEAQ